MGWIKLITVLFGMYVAHSYYLLSNEHVQDYLNEHNLVMISDPDLACRDYSDNVKFDIRHRTPAGGFKLIGGKKKLCDYMASGQHVLGAGTQKNVKHFVDMKVTSRFPWLSATANFDEYSQMDVNNMGTVHSKTHQVINLKRGVFGLQIVGFTSTGGVGF